MISRRYAQFLFALPLVLGLGGCASWFGDDTPDPAVHLVKVEVVQAKLMQQRFNLYFRVDNPADSDLTVRGLDYRIFLGNILLAEGEHEHWFTVEPKRSGFLKVPIRTNLWPKVRELVKLLEKDDQPIPYRLEGVMETGLFIAHDVHLARNGVIIPADLIPEHTR